MVCNTLLPLGDAEMSQLRIGRFISGISSSGRPASGISLLITCLSSNDVSEVDVFVKSACRQAILSLQTEPIFVELQQKIVET